jgi:hypothetical protein
VETIETLKISRRTRSEDDEFSWFAIADDARRPADIVQLKFDYLRGHINSGEDSIPAGVFDQIMAAVDAAEDAYCKGKPRAAESLLGNMETIVRDTPSIPHTYDPDNPGTNLAGRIISRAHTLAFSLRYSSDTALMSTAIVVPDVVYVNLPGRLLSAVVEIPEGLDAFDVDPGCVYMEGMAKCLPGSLSVADHDGDGQPEVRAVFLQDDVEGAFGEAGPATVEITCFIDGYEVHATADVEVVMPEAWIYASGEIEGGQVSTVTWQDFDCGTPDNYTLFFSEDAGVSWQIVRELIGAREYDWTVPDIDTDEGMLKVTCYDTGGSLHAAYSGLLTISSTAGVSGNVIETFRLVLSPNPARTGLNIEFASPRAQDVAVDVYSVRGELVKRLYRGRMEGGVGQLYWQGDNSVGRRVSPGTYFVVFRAETGTLTEKMIIQR